MGAEQERRILGVAGQMKMFSFFYGVVLGKLIVRHCDLSCTFQKQTYAAEGQEVLVAALTV